MQNLLGPGDKARLKSAAGLAGGVGHRGAACGILVGGAMALGFAGAGEDGDQATITAGRCVYVSEYVRRFRAQAGSTLCRDIAETDFDDDKQLRRYILARSLNCVKLASRSASIMTDIIAGKRQTPGDRYYKLNKGFSDRQFHCAHSVVVRASEKLDVNPVLSPNMLIPLNGGIGYSGSTCAALLGGCILIGLQRGGDTSQTGTFSLLRRMLLTLIHGSTAFNRLDLSPANDALLRCAELSKWFDSRFRSHVCRELTKVDFGEEDQARRYFEEDIISKCILMGEETAAKAAELAR